MLCRLYDPPRMIFRLPNNVPTSRRRMALWVRLLVVMVALFQGWASYASIVSLSHDAGNWPTHERALLAAESHGTEHSHDDDEPQTDDRGVLHQHGHNAADHSHEKPSLPRSAVQPALSAAEVWRASLHVLAYPAPCFVFERPPQFLPVY